MGWGRGQGEAGPLNFFASLSLSPTGLVSVFSALMHPLLTHFCGLVEEN